MAMVIGSQIMRFERTSSGLIGFWRGERGEERGGEGRGGEGRGGEGRGGEGRGGEGRGGEGEVGKGEGWREREGGGGKRGGKLVSNCSSSKSQFNATMCITLFINSTLGCYCCYTLCEN